MRYTIILFAGLGCCGSLNVAAQEEELYRHLKNELVAKYEHKPPGNFETFPKGVKTTLMTNRKVIALTFDACGGPDRNGYDEELIQFLRQERIPATLFISGLWIDEHLELVTELSKDTLFEIENHGLSHRPCSVNGESRYGVKGTENIPEVIDEIALNAEKIRQISHRKPVYFRPATATLDTVSVAIARDLGVTVIHFDVLPGDAVKGTSAKFMKDILVNKAHKGAIVLMHMNHPERNGREALMDAIPLLRKKGYSFVRLQGQSFRESR